MLNNKTAHSLTTFIYLLGILILSGCQATEKNIKTTTSLQLTPLNASQSVSFSPDGKLWRLTPTKQAMYVDVSIDSGKTFSLPVQVNSFEQKISAWPENPPAIEISPSGRINILYYADENQKSTSFFTYSDDNGQTFSSPSLISDHAQSAMHYMDKMLVDKENNVYLFWHDTRHESHNKELGNGVLSIYYSIIKPSGNPELNNTFLSNGICSCCRTATTFSNNGKPVVFARMVYKDGVRDHALIRMIDDDTWLKPQRVTNDNWDVEACPEHGPSISIDDKIAAI